MGWMPKWAIPKSNTRKKEKKKKSGGSGIGSARALALIEFFL